jgi:ABC-type multidrug transport system fused ATPase/permease subunit
MLSASCARITKSLMSESVDPNFAKQDKSDNILQIVGLHACWSNGSAEETVKDPSPKPKGLMRQRTSMDMTFDTIVDININLLPGTLAAIIGPVGSGKSSLLNSILGELYINKGTVTINGRIAYVEQEPWIISATVRENILMDKPFDEHRYIDIV